jgi:hypothetical protein
MGGTPANATVWPDADVYIGTLAATNPADIDAAFGTGWDLVGLLDGDQGFVHARSEDANERFAWGGILVRTTRKNYKETVAFTALEWNDTTRALVYPDSSPGTLVVPRPQRVKIALETREGDSVRRLISAYQADVVVNADVVDKEDDLTKYEFLATIYPTSDGELWFEQPHFGS